MDEWAGVDQTPPLFAVGMATSPTRHTRAAVTTTPSYNRQRQGEIRHATDKSRTDVAFPPPSHHHPTTDPLRIFFTESMNLPPPANRDPITLFFQRRQINTFDIDINNQWLPGPPLPNQRVRSGEMGASPQMTSIPYSKLKGE